MIKYLLLILPFTLQAEIIYTYKNNEDRSIVIDQVDSLVNFKFRKDDMDLDLYDPEKIPCYGEKCKQLKTDLHEVMNDIKEEREG